MLRKVPRGHHPAVPQQEPVSSAFRQVSGGDSLPEVLCLPELPLACLSLF